MKYCKWLALFSLAAVILFSDTAFAGGIAQTRKKQQRLIRHGFANGSLTWRETQRLKKEQVRIVTYRRRAMRDGHLSYRERKQLRQMQRQAFKHIRRLTRNDLRRQMRGKKGRIESPLENTFRNFGCHYDRRSS
jgi:hypothetical protein